jgi:two-component system response regulator VicR
MVLASMLRLGERKRVSRRLDARHNEKIVVHLRRLVQGQRVTKLALESTSEHFTKSWPSPSFRQPGHFTIIDLLARTYPRMFQEGGLMAKKKIVYIEDHADMIDLVRLILEPKGYEIIGAIGGREGVETIQQEMPDLVLLDLMMPDMDGWEVHRRMKADERLKEIPVIVVTAKDKPIDQVLGLHVAKVDAYLVKADFGPKELLDSVRQVLGEV